MRISLYISFIINLYKCILTLIKFVLIILSFDFILFDINIIHMQVFFCLKKCLLIV
jgi:hypothetical protein